MTKKEPVWAGTEGIHPAGISACSIVATRATYTAAILRRLFTAFPHPHRTD